MIAGPDGRCGASRCALASLSRVAGLPLFQRGVAGSHYGVAPERLPLAHIGPDLARDHHVMTRAATLQPVADHRLPLPARHPCGWAPSANTCRPCRSSRAKDSASSAVQPHTLPPNTIGAVKRLGPAERTMFHAAHPFWRKIEGVAFPDKDLQVGMCQSIQDLERENVCPKGSMTATRSLALRPDRDQLS